MAEEMRPTPEPDADTAPYWDAAREGRLSIPFCEACRTHFFYPRRYCPLCTSEQVGWRDVSGVGRVYSHTVVHKAPVPAFQEEIPYTVGLVELEEGPRIYTRIESTNGRVSIGDKVAVRFQKISDEVTLPYFEFTES